MRPFDIIENSLVAASVIGIYWIIYWILSHCTAKYSSATATTPTTAPALAALSSSSSKKPRWRPRARRYKRQQKKNQQSKPERILQDKPRFTFYVHKEGSFEALIAVDKVSGAVSVVDSTWSSNLPSPTPIIVDSGSSPTPIIDDNIRYSH